MTTGRAEHTATLLPNGKLLVAGGWGWDGSLLSSAELYNPATGTWTTAGSMSAARNRHTATLLPNGKVLVTGGGGGRGGYLSSAELYDPAAGPNGTWTSTTALITARARHTATLLSDGSVLIVAGAGSTGYLASAEQYYPENEMWMETGSLTTARHEASATLLLNGKVLVAGGYNGSYASSVECTGCIPIGSSSITANFVNVSQGSTLSGIAAIQASGSSASPLTAATLYVVGTRTDVDGGSGNYAFSLDTREFPNGTHNLVVAVHDNGEIGSTEDNESFEAPANYGIRTISVTFNNLLSNANLKYHNFKPDLGQVQTIYGNWSSSRHWQLDITADGQPGMIYRTFTGTGTAVNQQWDGRDTGGQIVLDELLNYAYFDLGPSAQPPLPMPQPIVKYIRAPSGILGTYSVIYQGHHPARLSGFIYPLPTGVTQGFWSDAPRGPWGRIFAASKIASDIAELYPFNGYYGAFGGNGVKGDDQVTRFDLVPTVFGGTGVYDFCDIGLFVGHQVYSKNAPLGLGHAQAYVPIYKQSNGTVTWVEQRDMSFGTLLHKWMAFYSCNLFRDSIYRQGGDYINTKFNISGTGLGMNTDLHILQGYATEMSVHPSFALFWGASLFGKSGTAEDHTVLGAWKRACRKTQPQNESAATENVSRSVYWPECQGDYLAGYGPSTVPDPDHVQLELLEADEFATGPP